MKLLTAEQIRKADNYTIKYEPISSADLMERAAERFVELYQQYYTKEYQIVILCGTGNNGGDGLVIGRLLIEDGYKVKLFIAGDQERGSKDFTINNETIRAYSVPTPILDETNFPKLTKDTIVIDALFGVGISRPITGFLAKLIHHVNTARYKEIVAVDIASGLGCEEKLDGSSIIRADRTITFEAPKLSFFLPENESHTGILHIVNIDLNKSFIDTFPSNFYLLTHGFIKSILKPRSKFIHKGLSGHNLIIAGSLGKIGAAALASRANLRTGAGLLTCHVPKCGLNILQTSIPEAMVIPSTGENVLEKNEICLSDYDSIGIGPGIGQAQDTISFFECFLDRLSQPVVIDADGLNILSKYPKMLKKVPKNSVLTPHPGEFKRLVGDWADDYERLKLQRAFSLKYGIILVLKGAYTSISTVEGEVYFNSTGNPGMATAGSGDVLLGIITALVGLDYPTIEAALLGVFLHGKSGDLFTETSGEESLIASDIIDNLGRAYQSLK